jgi:hypothetical protein
MTTAGTPSLNRPLPNRTEAETRIEMALKTLKHLQLIVGANSNLGRSLNRTISILEKGA